jgi:hypothetical protein
MLPPAREDQRQSPPAFAVVPLTEEMVAYSARTDLARSIDACYAAIRERVRNGGKPWTPPETVPRETGETACKPKPSC